MRQRETDRQRQRGGPTQRESKRQMGDRQRDRPTKTERNRQTDKNK